MPPWSSDADNFWSQALKVARDAYAITSTKTLAEVHACGSARPVLGLRMPETFPDLGRSFGGSNLQMHFLRRLYERPY